MVSVHAVNLARACGLLCAMVIVGCGDDSGGTSVSASEGSTSAVGTSTDATPTTTNATPTTTETMSTGTSGTSTGTTDAVSTSGETSSTTAMTATGSSTGVACDAPMTVCGDACVDTQSDVLHCGGCDLPCADGELCSAGSCALDCAADQVACGGACVDLQTDADNCGGCDMPCAPGELCGMGQCVLDCPMGQEACGDSCVDTQVDAANCGGCDQACDGCQTCTAGACEALPLPAAPGAIVGEVKPCGFSEQGYSIPVVPGAVSYTWTPPNGAMVTQGQGTEMVNVKFAGNDGELCVTYNDGCADSKPSCTAITLSGGVPGQKVFAAVAQAQNFVVPACISTIKVTAFGAQGGSVDGGKGAKMSGTFTVTPGETLGIVVGKQGVTNTCGGAPSTGGGGGGSFVWHENNKTEPMIAAGGGGGGNVNWGNLVCRKGLDAVTTINGTAGNGAQSALGGVNGLGGAGNAPSGTGAGGAGWKGNGQDSTYIASPSTGGKMPFLFSGGLGSPNFGPGGEGGFGGGGGAVCGCGGGGGYSGGGAGEGSSCRAGGGGGGSFNAGMNPDNLAGARLGDGEVTLAWP